MISRFYFYRQPMIQVEPQPRVGEPYKYQNGRIRRMKYIVYWKSQGEGRKLSETAQKLREDMKKNPEKYCKILFPSHLMVGERKGFYVVEATADQMMNTALFYGPLMDFKFVPIVKSTEMVTAAQRMGR